MAKLDAKKRNALPAKDFGEPGKRAYPMPDKAHAANAKARASQQEKAGKLSPAAKAKIDRKADAKLGKSGSAAKVVAQASKPNAYAKTTKPPKGCSSK